MADKNVLYRIVAATDGRLRTMETSIKKINSWIKTVRRTYAVQKYVVGGFGGAMPYTYVERRTPT